jgi:hypothetical protein
MDEARTVLARLERLDDLETRGAPPGALLAEVRVLLEEVEDWLAVEPVGTERAAAALGRCRAAFVARREVAMM